MGVKHDDGKLRFDLIPPEALEEIAAVLTHGAEKYSPDNWKKVGNKRERYLAAALRHINEYHKDNAWDADSSYHHLAHACCCMMFLLWEDLEG